MRELVGEGEAASVAARQAVELAEAMAVWDTLPPSEQAKAKAKPALFNFYQKSLNHVIDDVLTAEQKAHYVALAKERNSHVRGLEDWLKYVAEPSSVR